MCDKERIIDNKTKAKNIINLEYVWAIKVFLLTLQCRIKKYKLCSKRENIL